MLASLADGLRAAEELVLTERASGSVRGLILALRYWTLPLRIAFDFERATSAALESFELAAKHKLGEDAAAAADLVASKIGRASCRERV